MSTKSEFGGFAELQVIENVDEIELRRLRGGSSARRSLDRRWEVFSSEVFSSIGGRRSLARRSLARRYDFGSRDSEVGDLEFGGLLLGGGRAEFGGRKSEV